MTYEPKPLFPKKVTEDMVKPITPVPVIPSRPNRNPPGNNAKPAYTQPVFSIPGKSATDPGHETTDFISYQPKPLPKPAPKPEAKTKYDVKPLFANKAVSAEAEIEPWIALHPLCVGLDKKSLARIRNIINAADFDDTTYVLNYADNLNVKFSQLVNDISSEATSPESLAVNDKMEAAYQLLVSLNPNIITDAKVPSLMDRFVTSISGVPHAWTEASTVASTAKARMIKLDELAKELVHDIKKVIKRVDHLDQLREANQENYESLNLYVVAGDLILRKYRDTILPKKSLNIKGDDFFANQALSSLKDTVDRFERKVTELKMVAHSMMTNVPQIRLLQQASYLRADNINRLAKICVPAMKTSWIALAEELTTHGKKPVYEVSQVVATRRSVSLQRLKLDFADAAANFSK